MRVVPTPWPENVLVLQEEGTLPLEGFSAEERLQSASFRLAKRRDEFLLSRFAAKQLALKLGICSDAGQCQVDDRSLVLAVRPTDVAWRVSLSHSAPYAAAAISTEAVGIDVQVIRPFDEGAAHLFLTPHEIAAMLRSSIDHRLLHYWCAKEAAWKRRSDRYATMKRLPLELIEETANSLRFDDAMTIRVDDVIVAYSG